MSSVNKRSPVLKVHNPLSAIDTQKVDAQTLTGWHELDFCVGLARHRNDLAHAFAAKEILMVDERLYLELNMSVVPLSTVIAQNPGEFADRITAITACLRNSLDFRGDRRLVGRQRYRARLRMLRCKVPLQPSRHPSRWLRVWLDTRHHKLS